MYTLVRTIEKNVKLMQKPENSTLEQETALLTQERDYLKDFLYGNRGIAIQQLEML